jgi:DNA-binding LacI/PurR family transcriptional regulator
VARRALKVLALEGRLQTAPKRVGVVALGTPLSTLMQNLVVLVLNTPVNHALPYRRALWDHINAAAEEDGFPLFILHHPDKTRVELPTGLSALPLRSVLLLGPFSRPLLRRYENWSVRAVLIDQPGDDYRLHSVAVANYDGAFEATSRLIAAGHRRIGFVRTLIGSLQAVDPDSKEREAGFVAACVKAGFKSSQYKTFSTFVGRTRGFSANDLIADRPRYTAVLCSNSDHAQKVATLARAAGLQIPHDLSILTFHTAGESQTDWAGPRTDFGELGRATVKILRRRSTDIARVRVLPTWNEGTTFAPPPESSIENAD